MTLDRLTIHSERIFLNALAGLALAVIIAASPAFAASGDDVVAAPPAGEDGSAAGTQNPAPGTWQHQYVTARKLIDTKDYQSAIIALTAIERPNNVEILNLLGFTHRKLGRMQAAQKYYEAALAIDPDHVGVLEYYGEWHISEGDLEQAREHLARIRAVCGSNCREYKLLAERLADPDTESDDSWE